MAAIAAGGVGAVVLAVVAALTFTKGLDPEEKKARADAAEADRAAWAARVGQAVVAGVDAGSLEVKISPERVMNKTLATTIIPEFEGHQIIITVMDADKPKPGEGGKYCYRVGWANVGLGTSAETLCFARPALPPVEYSNAEGATR